LALQHFSLATCICFGRLFPATLTNEFMGLWTDFSLCSLPFPSRSWHLYTLQDSSIFNIRIHRQRIRRVHWIMSHTVLQHLRWSLALTTKRNRWNTQGSWEFSSGECSLSPTQRSKCNTRDLSGTVASSFQQLQSPPAPFYLSLHLCTFQRYTEQRAPFPQIALPITNQLRRSRIVPNECERYLSFRSPQVCLQYSRNTVRSTQSAHAAQNVRELRYDLPQSKR